LRLFAVRTGVVSRLAQTAGCDNGGDYGFSTFTVNPDQITANYVSLGGFSDNYAIKVPNPPGDFSVNSGVVSVSQGIVGGSGIYSSFGTLNINSFGSFSSSVSLAVGSVSGGLAGTCPGSNCPTLSVSPTTVQPQADGTVSSTLTVSTTTGTPCGNPQQSPASEYSVTLTATSGSMTPRSLTVHIYVYAQSDPTKDGVDNIVDVALVNGLFGQNLGAPRYNPNIDLNNDGRINIIDVTIVNSRFGTVC